MKSNKIINFDSVERYFPDYLYGLNQNQVKSRIDSGLKCEANVFKKHSLLFNVLKDIFSIANISVLLIIVMLILGGFYWSILFSLFLIFNTGLEIFMDLRNHEKEQNNRERTHCFKVIREGIESNILEKDIVLDDVLLLESGSVCPVDGVILNGSICADESNVNGKNNISYKNIGETVLSGSTIVTEKAYVRVDKLNSNSLEKEALEIADTIKKPKNPITYCFDVIELLLAGFAILFIALFFISKVTSNAPLDFGTIKNVLGECGNILILSAPLGLYLFITIKLTISALTLEKKKIIFKNPETISAFSNIDTICIDKTGTLITDNTRVKSVYVLNEGIKDNHIKQIVSNLIIVTNDNNSVTRALKEYFDYELTANASSVISFGENGNYCAASFKAGKTYVLGVIEQLNMQNKQALIKRCSEFTDAGYRVLVLGESYSQLSEGFLPGEASAIALIVLEDNYEREIVEQFENLKNSGKTIKIITGDSAIAASEISKKFGIDGAERYISLKGMAIQEVKSCVNIYNVFGDAGAEQKAAIISSLQDKGHQVCMIGDGINDLAALKIANCSICMKHGSDISKDSSDILLDSFGKDNLTQLFSEGNKALKYLNNSAPLFAGYYVFMLLSFVFGTLLSIFTGETAFNNSLACLPIQIYWHIGLSIVSVYLLFGLGSEQKNKFEIKYLIMKSAFCGILLTIAYIIPYLLLFMENQNWAYFNLIDSSKATSISSIAVTLMLFSVTVNISTPIKKKNILKLITIFIYFVAAFTYDIIVSLSGNENLSILKLNINDLTPINYFTSGVIFAILTIVLFGVNYIFEEIKKEKDNENI